ncbi:hypothetical protein LCM20_07315 [Halobacillus litoralis]|uniref:hypothetical protein n=1 Tax=Halobacillus litoralis TaxID=45668 RepID=UPI001CD2A797|nr:hypothetical protein [Halobacillus litoralis]MCA0970393.1 hypothetical protein [Halobacillus litoralis]
MKKWLLAMGLTGALVLAGCGSDSTASEENGNASQSEETETKQDETAVKKQLLATQMNIKDAFKEQQAKISDYEAAISAEEPDTETITTAADEAKAAADEAAKKAADYSIEAELPEDVTTQVQEAVASLQAYYEEVAAALEENPESADFTLAEEQFTQFNDQLGALYEEVGLLAPDMKKELS